MNASRTRQKHLLLTGARRGVGAILHQTLAEEYSIWPVYRQQPGSPEPQPSSNTHNSAGMFHGDLLSEPLQTTLKNTLSQLKEPLYGIIHCVGPIVYSSRAVPDWDVWETMYRQNLQFAVFLFRELLPLMNGGRVILFGFSGNDTSRGYKNIAAYAGAKASLAVLMRSAVRDAARRGVTVNLICPGVFTELDGTVPAHGGRLLSAIPLGRLGGADDISGVVRWLLSPGSRYVTGQIVKVSGGLHIY